MHVAVHEGRGQGLIAKIDGFRSGVLRRQFVADEDYPAAVFHQNSTAVSEVLSAGDGSCPVQGQLSIYMEDKSVRIQGVLDFSLIGILAKLSGILAEHRIGIFAVSTFNTDYILVKRENFGRALEVLSSAGYTVL